MIIREMGVTITFKVKLCLVAPTILAIVGLLWMVDMVAAATPPVTDGLVGFYDFSRDSGNTVVDLSGHGNNGVATGTARGQLPDGTYYRDLNGGGDHISIPPSSSLSYASPATISFGLKIKTPPDVSALYGKLLMSRYFAGYAIYMTPSGNLQYIIYTDGGVQQSYIGRTPLASNTNYILFVTYDGKHLQGYINGQRDGDGYGWTSQTFAKYDEYWTVSGDQDGYNQAKMTVFAIYLYDRALSAPEVAGLWTNGKAEVDFSANDYFVSKLKNSINVTVSLTDVLPYDVSVDYTTNNGDALAGTNYVAARGTLTFHSGEVTKNITIPITSNDGLLWNNKLKFYLTLSDPVNVTVGMNNPATVSIGNNGGIILTFDDYSIDAWYGIRDILRSYDAKATFYCEGAGYPASSPDQKAELQALIDDGNSIQSHSYFHYNAPQYVDQYGLQGYIDTEITPDIQLMNDFGGTPTSFAYPGGDRTAYLDSVLLTYFDSVRDVAYPVNYGNDVSEDDGAFYEFDGTNTRLFSTAMTDNIYNTPAESFYGGMDRALEKGEVLGILCHTPSDNGLPYSTPISKLADIVKYAHDHGLTFYTTNTLFPAQNDVTLTLDKSTVNETDGNIQINVIRTGQKNRTLVLDYDTADGTAVNGKEYVGSSGVLKFIVGVDSQVISLHLNDDHVNNSNEYFYLNMRSPDNTTRGPDRQYKITILDNDPVPIPTPTPTPTATPSPTPTPSPKPLPSPTPTITPTPTPGPILYQINIKQGWNLVSIPLVNDTLWASQLGDIGVRRVSSYNVDSGGYDTFVVGFSPPSDDIQMKADHAYFVDCGSDVTFDLYGVEDEQRSATVYPRWNAVGWSSLSTVKASDISGRLGNIQRICRYNGSSGNYDTYVVGFSGEDMNFDIMPGDGFFLYLDSDTPGILSLGGL